MRYVLKTICALAVSVSFLGAASQASAAICDPDTDQRECAGEACATASLGTSRMDYNSYNLIVCLNNRSGSPAHIWKSMTSLSSVFGSWEEIGEGTGTAQTDGIIIGYHIATAADESCTEKVAVGGVTRSAVGNHSDGSNGTLMAPVKKGQVWKVWGGCLGEIHYNNEEFTIGGRVFWIPFNE